jgi:tetratricopeptide (TPR) repeat protein
MSLLMEALRKAEEAKRKGQEQQSPAEPPAADEDSKPTPEAAPRPQTAFTLEPLDIPSPAPQQTDTGAMALEMPPPYERELPRATPDDHSLTMNEVDNFLDPAPAPEDNTPARTRRTRNTGQTRDQLAAASVFAARKQAPKRNQHLKILLPVLAVAIPLVGIGLWFLSQLQGDSLTVNPAIANYNPNRGFLEDQLVVEDSAIDATESATPVIAAIPAAEDPIAEPPAPDTATTALATPAAPEPAPVLPPVVAPQPAAPPPSATQAQTAQAGIQLPAAEPASTTRLQISRSQGRTQVNSTLLTAWNTLQAGDSGRALLLYQEVLAELPNNRDALLGMAAIQERSGQGEQARQLYVRLLALNPQDPLARAGLLQGMQAGSAPAQEGELRALLNRYPELAPLHFALGNLFAGQQRWSEAQHAYFTALLHAGRGNNGPVSPDYAFNLAVSLEQLQQPRVALDYYRQARDLALTSPPGFDPEQLRSRLAFLEQNHP